MVTLTYGIIVCTIAFLGFLVCVMRVLTLKKIVLSLLIQATTIANAEYQSYGISEQIDYLLIPKTHIWRENPRMWTIKKYLDSGSKFSLVYALQEADCDRNKLRFRSQTWVIRNDSEEDQLLTDTSVKRWRNLKSESFEEILHIFLCTYVQEKEDE